MTVHMYILYICTLDSVDTEICSLIENMFVSLVVCQGVTPCSHQPRYLLKFIHSQMLEHNFLVWMINMQVYTANLENVERVVIKL